MSGEGITEEVKEAMRKKISLEVWWRFNEMRLMERVEQREEGGIERHKV